jgi:hypothetical protein
MIKKLMKSFNDYIVHIFIGLGLIVFYLDSLTPPGYAEWILYSLLLFVFTRLGNKNSILIIAGLYGLFVVAGFFTYTPRNVPISVPLINRSLGIIVLLVIAYLGISLKRPKKADNSSNNA